MIRNTIVLIILSLFISGCGDDIDDYINKKYPPVSLEAQRQEATATTLSALEKLDSPNFGFGSPLSLLRSAFISSGELSSLGVKDIRLSSSDQMMRVEIDFRRNFSGNAENRADLVSRLNPSVEGTISFYAGLASSTELDSALRSIIAIKILPVFESISVSKVTIAENYDVTALGDALVSVLNRYAENISGELSRLPIMRVKVPTRLAEPLDPNKTIRIDGDAVNGEVSITGNVVSTPIELTGIAFLLDGDEVITLAQFAPVTVVTGEQNLLPKSTTIALKENTIVENFRTIIEESFGLTSYPNAAWAVLRKDLVATSANSFFNQASICFSVNADIARQQHSEPITFPDENTVDCTPTRDCTPSRNCDVSASHDTRDCGRCLYTQCPTWREPFRQCKKCFNDPVCEAAKAAQNLIYQADYSAKKLDCERLKLQDKASCELEKTVEKSFCETGKELLKRLARTGKFANINLSYSGKTQLRACIKDFTFGPDLGTLHSKLDISGGGNMEVDVKFVPLDIIGHLTCLFPWTESQKFVVKVPSQTVLLQSSLKFVDDGTRTGFDFQTSEVGVDLTVDPWPSMVLLTSANLNLACQGMALLRPLIIPATAYVPELRGQFTYKAKPMSMSANLGKPVVDILGSKIKLRGFETDRAIVLEGQIAGQP